MKPLTSRQQEILNFIERQRKKNHPFPSYSEIAQRFDISKPGVFRHMQALKKKGYIQSNEAPSRAFSLSNEFAPHSFPFAAKIAAGAPQESFERSNESLEICPSFFGSSSLIALQVQGESMTGDFIGDGDYVLIQKSFHMNTKSIFAVRIQGEITLKRLKKKGRYIELISSNPDFAIQRYLAENVEILGQLKGLIRKV